MNSSPFSSGKKDLLSELTNLCSLLQVIFGGRSKQFFPLEQKLWMRHRDISSYRCIAPFPESFLRLVPDLKIRPDLGRVGVGGVLDKPLANRDVSNALARRDPLDRRSL